MLAELGADVIKVERAGKGDDARGWGPPFHDGVGTIFRALNRNKRSVAVDLGNAEELARLRALLIDETDVLIQNMRPGQVEKLGLGAEALLADNPRLIHASIGAFGKTGPLSERPGYDPLMQAFGGIMSVTGGGGGGPAAGARRHLAGRYGLRHVGGDRRAFRRCSAVPRPARAGSSVLRCSKPR